jgi:hypothetical protein
MLDKQMAVVDVLGKHASTTRPAEIDQKNLRRFKRPDGSSVLICRWFFARTKLHSGGSAGAQLAGLIKSSAEAADLLVLH